MSVLQPLFQSQGGKQQNLFAPGGPVSLVGRDEGVGGHASGQRGFSQSQGEGNPAEVLGEVREGGHPLPFLTQPMNVQFTDQQSLGKPALGQESAVFGNQVVSAEDQVSGGFPLADVCVHIAADQPSGGGGDQTPAVLILAHRFVGGRQVQNYRGSGSRQTGRGRIRDPQVFADFHTQPELGQGIAAENLAHSKGNFLTAKDNRVQNCRVGRLEPAGFIEFGIIGKVLFGNQSQNVTPLNQGGTVVEFAVFHHRNAQSAENF